MSSLSLVDQHAVIRFPIRTVFEPHRSYARNHETYIREPAIYAYTSFMSDSSHPVDRLVSVLEHASRQLDDDEYLFYFDIHKLLYYLDARIDDDNSFKEALSFHWYEDGPVATVTQSVADRSREGGVFETTPTPHGQKFHPAGGTISVTDDDEDLQEAKEAIDTILEEEYDLTAPKEEKIDQVYRDAPYEFQRRFKKDVIPKVEELGEVLGPLPKDVYRAISRTEAYLPFEDDFQEVNDLYSRYVDVSRSVLADREDVSDEGGTRFEELTMEYWEVFCAKLRLETTPEDVDAQTVSRWTSEYHSKVEAFRATLDEFETAFANADTRQPTRAVEDSTWGQLADGLLNRSD